MITEYGIEAKSNAEIISELGGRFKEYRLFCDLTQKEVAEKAGVSVFTISQFEKGDARFSGRSRKVASSITYAAQPDEKFQGKERKGKT